MDNRKKCHALDDGRIDKLLDGMRRVQYLREQRRPAEALDACRSIIQQAERLGIDSPDVTYMAARAAFHAGEWEAALLYATRVIAVDPLSLSGRASLEEIAARARRELAERESVDGLVPRLYDLLVRARKADSRTHVAMARYLRRNGRAAEAASLLDAVTRLSPAARDAWALRGELALADGDRVLAAECAAAAASSSSEPAQVLLPLAKA